ncbi:ankyrin repeat domain-containing protein [Candidatus Babeliales bacterium]|nr:ankyrin repeat domain-containing protein [Candidatus Babeliales bacterium]
MISKVSKVVALSLLLGSPVWAASSSSRVGGGLSSVCTSGEKCFLAVERGNTTALAKHLLSLQMSADDVRKPHGSTLLHWAVLHEQLGVIKWLGENGDSDLVNAQDNKGRTPLHLAAKKRQVSIVKALWEYFEGVDLNIQDETGATPVHGAVMAGLKDTVLYLCERFGLDVDVRDFTGFTPLRYATIDRFASIAEQLAVVDALIKCGANKNAFNAAPYARLCFAAAQGNVLGMSAALTMGADLNAPDAKGCSPLHYAVMSKNLNAIAFLLERRVLIDVKNNAGETPYNIAEQLQDEGAKQLLRFYSEQSR